jgi:hypothetical protein
MPEALGPEQLDQVVDAVLARLAGLEPDPESANLSFPPGRLGGADGIPRERLVIAGLELTQSIQYNDVVSPNYGERNSVPLVALKALTLRVYPYIISGLRLGGGLEGARVTGEVVLSVGERVVYRTGPTRPGARIGPLENLDRELWDTELMVPGGGDRFSLGLVELNPPLNFLIPAWYCRAGRAVVTARVWVGGPTGWQPGRSASEWQRIEFLDVGPPKLCLVRVNWTSSSGTTTSPTDAQMLATVRRAERMLPFPYFQTTILGIEETSSAAFAMLPSKTGKCNAAWDQLLTDLAVTRIFTALFGLGSLVVGMVPTAAIPAGTTTYVAGCGGQAGGCFVGDGTSFAHELSHMYDRHHVDVAGDPDVDTAYPNYGGSKRSIGEVGIDTGTSPPTLFPPRSWDDIMSYGSNRWISPYTYQALLNARGMHETAPADPARVRSWLVFSVRFHRGQDVEVRRGIRLDAAGTVPGQGKSGFSPLSIDILGRDGELLATHECLYVPTHGCGCRDCAERQAEDEPFLDLNEAVEWPLEATGIAFRRRRETLATLDAGDPPRVEIEGPERVERRLRLRVRAEHPRQQPSVVVLFKGNDGEQWVPVALDPPDELTIDADRLPGGSRSRFRAIATAELESAVADTEPFELDPAPRRIHVLSPAEGDTVAAGPLALSVAVEGWQDTLTPEAVRWRSDLAGDLGAGYELTSELGPGRHLVTVVVPDGLGGEASAAVRITAE